MIVDYGMGNVGSILNMLKRIGVASECTCDLDRIRKAEKIILPGVGAFDKAMQNLNKTGIRQVLDEVVLNRKVHVLGICLGMQLLTNSSEEGNETGLGWIRATTKRFPTRHDLKVPHMGWNTVSAIGSHPLVDSLPEKSRFYFVHSYYVRVDNPADSMLKTTYDITFDSAISHSNIHGVQFHPEKSHRYGMDFLKSFARL